VGPDRGGTADLTAAVRVVPDVPSFSVDDGFAYSVPDGLDVEIGAVVRVPLGGRRVRGWVVGEHRGETSRLKPIGTRSGDLPVFDRKLLDVMRWAAIRYVAPLAAVLGKATPPNVPRRRNVPELSSIERPADPGEFVRSLEAGRRPATTVWAGRGPRGGSIIELAGPVLAIGRSVLLIAPTSWEAAALGKDLEAAVPGRVTIVRPEDSAAEHTAAWALAATQPGRLVVATRGASFWRVAGLGAAMAVGEGRRGMKDKATPTTHARQVLLKRSQVERFGLVLADLVPSAEAAGLAPVQRIPDSREWGLVEIVDRRHEEESGTLLGATARAALRSAVSDGRRVLVFTHRRTTAQRCGRCRTVRACEVCGAGVFESAAECARCGAPSRQCASCGFGRFEMLGSGAARVTAEVARVVGREHVGGRGDGRSVIVGTERDLPGLEVDLTLIVDADGPLLAPTYRAGEDGLRLLARAVAAAGTGRGRRGLVQTSNPDHPALEALLRGDPRPFIAADGAERANAGFPPGGELLVLEVEDATPGADEELVEAVGTRAQVLGPADHRGKVRWLLQGADLTAARVAVRSVVGRWRDGGARVRVDADPIEL